MMINKRWALFMVIVNAAFVICSIVYLIYTNQSLFKNFRQQSVYIQPPYNTILLVTFGVFNFIIFIGLYWVLKVFKVKRWLRIGIIILNSWRVIILTLAACISSYYRLYNFVRQPEFLIVGITKLILLYVLISFLFIRHKTIRKYYRAFALLLIFTYAMDILEPHLYDSFGYSWILINTSFLEQLAYIASLILFIEVYNISRQSTIANDDQIIVLANE